MPSDSESFRECCGKAWNGKRARNGGWRVSGGQFASLSNNGVDCDVQGRFMMTVPSAGARRVPKPASATVSATSILRKLIRVLSGHIWDVAIDLRRNRPTLGKWAGFNLKAQSVDDPLELLWIPEGFAHGFLVLSETAEVLYKTTDIYYPAGERSILWNDPTLNIAWPLEALKGTPVFVSPKDERGSLFTEADLPPS